MNFKQLNTVYFIGVGGIGMSAIARYFLSLNKQVYGYDKTPNEFTYLLEKEGMIIHYHEDIKSIPEQVYEEEQSLVIYTPAIPSNHAELVHLKSKNIKVYKRAEILGLISKNTYTIAVAGTHGKTTTSCLIAHLLHSNGINFTGFLGGISSNYQSNFIEYKKGIELFDMPISVVEADEYDRSFLQLSPNVSIITSTDADHLDIYGEAEKVKSSFQSFVECLLPNGHAIIKQGLDLTCPYNLITYGYQNNSGASYQNVNIVDHKFNFEFSYLHHAMNLKMGLPGLHNVENATAAIVVALLLGIEPQGIMNAIETFKGVKRRFDYIVNNEKGIYIDDYAHHPTELTACINSVKMMYPNKKITGIFQPHLFSRTRDFADDFAESLNLLDECWLLDIYPAREMPIEGITSEYLALKMNSNVCLTTNTEILKKLKENKPEVLLTLGAGDIDKLIQPIKDLYA
jgi:UDP-N-acetylmuramate--alanine ligase